MPKKPLDRNKLKRQTIVLMRKNGYSYQEIGDTVCLTRERIRQILEKEGLTDKQLRNKIKDNQRSSKINQ